MCLGRRQGREISLICKVVRMEFKPIDGGKTMSSSLDSTKSSTGSCTNSLKEVNSKNKSDLDHERQVLRGDEEDLALFQDILKRPNCIIHELPAEEIGHALSRKLSGLTDDSCLTPKSEFDWLMTPPDTPLSTSQDRSDLFIKHYEKGRRQNRSPLASAQRPIRRALSKGDLNSGRLQRNAAPKQQSLDLSSSSSLNSISKSTTFKTESLSGSYKTQSSFPSPSRVTPIGKSSRPSTPTKTMSKTITEKHNQDTRGQRFVEERRGRSQGKSPQRNSLSKVYAWQSDIPDFSADPPPNLKTNFSDQLNTRSRGLSPSARSADNRGNTRGLSPSARSADNRGNTRGLSPSARSADNRRNTRGLSPTRPAENKKNTRRQSVSPGVSRQCRITNTNGSDNFMTFPMKMSNTKGTMPEEGAHNKESTQEAARQFASIQESKSKAPNIMGATARPSGRHQSPASKFRPLMLDAPKSFNGSPKHGFKPLMLDAPSKSFSGSPKHEFERHNLTTRSQVISNGKGRPKQRFCENAQAAENNSLSSDDKSKEHKTAEGDSMTSSIISREDHEIIETNGDADGRMEADLACSEVVLTKDNFFAEAVDKLDKILTNGVSKIFESHPSYVARDGIMPNDVNLEAIESDIFNRIENLLSNKKDSVSDGTVNTNKLELHGAADCEQETVSIMKETLREFEIACMEKHDSWLRGHKMTYEDTEQLHPCHTVDHTDKSEADKEGLQSDNMGSISEVTNADKLDHDLFTGRNVTIAKDSETNKIKSEKLQPCNSIVSYLTLNNDPDSKENIEGDSLVLISQNTEVEDADSFPLPSATKGGPMFDLPSKNEFKQNDPSKVAIVSETNLVTDSSNSTEFSGNHNLSSSDTFSLDVMSDSNDSSGSSVSSIFSVDMPATPNAERDRYMLSTSEDTFETRKQDSVVYRNTSETSSTSNEDDHAPSALETTLESKFMQPLPFVDTSNVASPNFHQSSMGRKVVNEIQNLDSLQDVCEKTNSMRAESLERNFSAFTFHADTFEINARNSAGSNCDINITTPEIQDKLCRNLSTNEKIDENCHQECVVDTSETVSKCDLNSAEKGIADFDLERQLLCPDVRSISISKESLFEANKPAETFINSNDTSQVDTAHEKEENHKTSSVSSRGSFESDTVGRFKQLKSFKSFTTNFADRVATGALTSARGSPKEGRMVRKDSVRSIGDSAWVDNSSNASEGGSNDLADIKNGIHRKASSFTSNVAFLRDNRQQGTRRSKRFNKSSFLDRANSLQHERLVQSQESQELSDVFNGSKTGLLTSSNSALQDIEKSTELGMYKEMHATSACSILPTPDQDMGHSSVTSFSEQAASITWRGPKQEIPSNLLSPVESNGIKQEKEPMLRVITVPQRDALVHERRRQKKCGCSCQIL